MKAQLIRALLAVPGFAWFCRQVLDVQAEQEQLEALDSIDARIAISAGRLFRENTESAMSALIAAEALELYGAEQRIVTIEVKHQHLFVVLEDGRYYPLPRATEAWQESGAPLN